MPNLRNYIVWRCVLALFFAVVASCQSQPNETPPKPLRKYSNKAYYYWQSVFRLDAELQQHLQQLNVKYLYIKFFDVDWNIATQQAIPIAPIVFADSIPESMQIQIIPTVFITNQTLEQLPDTAVGTLARNISSKLNGILTQKKLQAKQIQIDCDWTASTRQRYFTLLDSLHQQPDNQARQLSVTIRLHQIKYAAQTGVPPANRGMLMVYNLDDVTNPKTANAILSLATLQRYVGNLPKYTLPLDVAMPLFSWGVVYRRGGFEQIINELHTNELQRNTRDFYKLAPNRFKVMNNCYVRGVYLYANDEIRIDELSTQTIEKAATIINQKLKTDSITVSLFHLDTAILRYYSATQCQGIYEALQ